MSGSYHRVIPRDLFNEAGLLKALGRVALLILEGLAPDGMELRQTTEGAPFTIEQDPADGQIFCGNFTLVVGRLRGALSRPLNSRDAWGLYLTDTYTQQELTVFDAEGNFTQELQDWASQT